MTTELQQYLERLCSAYRRSYKLINRINKAFLISSGILTSVAILSVIPVVPVAIAITAISPVILMVVSENLKLTPRCVNLKQQHRFYKQLLTYLQKGEVDEEAAIKHVREQDILNQKQEYYVTPLERYMKHYKLNGYS